jgi:hypothetical protein
VSASPPSGHQGPNTPGQGPPNANARVPRASPFNDIGLDELLQRPPKPFLVDGLFARGDHCMIYGDSGTGKSLVSIDTAIRVAMGLPVFGALDTARPLTVVYCAEEGLSGLPERFRQACEHLGLDSDSEAFKLIRIIECTPKLFEDPGEPECVDVFIGDLRAIESDQGYQIDLVIIDTYADAARGANENDNGDTGTINARIAEIIKAIGCAVLLVHHTTKNGESFRGASAIKAKCDQMAEVVGLDGVRTISCFKSKDAPPFTSQRFKLVKSGESAVVEWLGPTDQKPGGRAQARDAWQTELIEVLKRNATNSDTGKTPAQIKPIMQYGPTVRTLQDRLAALAKDPTSAVSAELRNVTNQDGTKNRTGWHYWIDLP